VITKNTEWLTEAQVAALHKLAAAKGWDKKSPQELGLLLWALFHYYALRLPHIS